MVYWSSHSTWLSICDIIYMSMYQLISSNTSYYEDYDNHWLVAKERLATAKSGNVSLIVMTLFHSWVQTTYKSYIIFIFRSEKRIKSPSLKSYLTDPSPWRYTKKNWGVTWAVFWLWRWWDWMECGHLVIQVEEQSLLILRVKLLFEFLIWCSRSFYLFGPISNMTNLSIQDFNISMALTALTKLAQFLA